MYLISACLTGENVKYDGTNNFHKVAKELLDRNLAIPVCPEVLGGLSTPRIPAEISGNSVRSKDGKDVTMFFEKGAQKTLEIAQKHNVTLAILQARSPSCGVHHIYDGSHTNRLIKGKGITTSLLEAHGIKVVTIDDFIKDYYHAD